MSALTDIFTSLANKIRTKLGTTTTYTPTQAIAAIDDVYDKGVADGATPTQTKTVTAGTSATTVTPDTGYALSSVTVNPTPSQSKSATPSTSTQTISPDSGKLLSSVSIGAISPQRSNGTAATGSGIDSHGPYVYIPYGYWLEYSGKAGSSYTYLTAAQAVAVCPKQEKSITATTSAQSVTPDSGKLLSKVTVNKYPDASGTYTYPANSTGGTYDMGATNNLRYVNATNVYNKGKADGSSGSRASFTYVYNVGNSSAVTLTGLTVGDTLVLQPYTIDDNQGYRDALNGLTKTGLTALSIANKGKTGGASNTINGPLVYRITSSKVTIARSGSGYAIYIIHSA